MISRNSEVFWDRSPCWYSVVDPLSAKPSHLHVKNRNPTMVTFYAATPKNNLLPIPLDDLDIGQSRSNDFTFLVEFFVTGMWLHDKDFFFEIRAALCAPQLNGNRAFKETVRKAVF